MPWPTTPTPDISVVYTYYAKTYARNPYLTIFGDTMQYSIDSNNTKTQYFYFNIPAQISCLKPSEATLAASDLVAVLGAWIKTSLPYYSSDEPAGYVGIDGPDELGFYTLYIMGCFADYPRTSEYQKYHIILRNGWYFLSRDYIYFESIGWTYTPLLESLNSIVLNFNLTGSISTTGRAAPYIFIYKIGKQANLPITSGDVGKTLRISTNWTNFGPSHTFKVFLGYGTGDLTSFSFRQYASTSVIADTPGAILTTTIDLSLATVDIGNWNLACILTDATGITVETITYTYDMMVENNKINVMAAGTRGAGVEGLSAVII